MEKKIQNSKSKTQNSKLITDNRKARFQYQLGERFEAGVVLTGSEVKSIRQGHLGLSDAYAEIVNGEIFLAQANISPYDKGGYSNHEPKRRRKLLLHKREIIKLDAKVNAKGMTLIPTKVYFKNGKVKVELALASGKTHGDKRQTIKERETAREMEREMKRRK
jgi:SsrA-binding protein